MDENLRKELAKFRLNLVKEVLRVDEQYSEFLGTARFLNPTGPTVDDLITLAQIGGLRIGYARVLNALFGIHIYDKAHPLND